VLRYYASHGGLSDGVATGFVELRRSDYIADGPSQFLLHGAPVINDCIYRNMHRFRHILVVDYDEVPDSFRIALSFSSRAHVVLNIQLPQWHFIHRFHRLTTHQSSPLTLSFRGLKAFLFCKSFPP